MHLSFKILIDFGLIGIINTFGVLMTVFQFLEIHFR